jgi:hypothetical protein
LPDRGGEVATLLRRAVVEVSGYPYPGDRLDRRRKLAGRDPTGPAVFGEDQRPWLAETARAEIEYDGQPGPATRRNPDHVANLEPLE